jgi:lipoyl(octanoyl) transferase
VAAPVFDVVGVAPEAVDYLDAWELQRRVHADVVAGDRPDTVLLLEHPPTYTAGKRTEPHERPVDSGGAPVIEVDRGGKVTFHGPGQIVAYPIVRLPEHVLVVDFVRRLEEAMIATCADFGVATARVPGRSGVWLQADEPRDVFGGSTGGGAPRVERKIGAIGLRVSQGVTMHGIALNCDVDLSWYDRFVPCGIADAGVTTLSLEVGRPVGVPEVLPVLRTRLAELLAWAPYTPTPDYESRPDPAKRMTEQPRIELVRP